MPQKKKKRKPRARAQGGGRDQDSSVEIPRPEEKKRERLEQRREARAKVVAQQRRRQSSRRTLRLVALFGLGLLAFWFLFLRGGIPSEIDGHEIENYKTFTSESQANQLHLTEGQQAPTYESTPPVSGLHDPNPAACGVHGEQVPDVSMVHTLEHGSVGILYRPDDVSAADIEAIEALVRSYDDHVFSEPYPDMDTPIAMVAWAHLMRLDTYEEQAVTDFIDLFRNDGDAPEVDTPCAPDSDESFTPSPSPIASPSKSAKEK